jgi:hypothetical protein
MTTRTIPSLVWRAHDKAGIAHALPKNVIGTTRYLCGRMPIAERFAWPARERCATCVALVAAQAE